MLARALCQEPKLLVMDEPTSFLDIRNKLEFLSILRRLVRERKLTVVMSLHELDLAQKFCDRIVCVGDGKIRAFVERVVCLLLGLYFHVSVPDANAPFRLMRAEVVAKYLPRMAADYNLPNIMLTTFFS